MPAVTPLPLAADAALVRAIGLRQLTAAILNATVGAGIFVLPALVAQGVGAAAPLAFLVCAAIIGLIAVALAMAGSRVALTGGIYAYVEVAFGPYLALLAGVLQWLTGVAAVSGIATALLDQLATLAPLLDGGAARLLVLAGMLTALASLNARGVRVGTRVIEAVTALKLAPLVLFVAAGAFLLDWSALVWPGLPDRDALGRSVLLLIFAYTGVEMAIAPSGEVKDPARTVPRAVLLALALATTLYIAIQLVAQAASGPELAQETGAPLAEAAGRFLGRAGTTLMLAGAVCSMFGYLCGDMLSTPRILYAFARDGLLPPAFARVHPTWRTPVPAIWTHAAIVMLLAWSQSFQALAIISNVGTLLLYLLCCGAALELERRDVRMSAEPFTFAAARLAPIAGAVLVLWILSTATAREFAVTGGVLAAASLAYVFRKRAPFR
ncbi:MAG: APC family permease [Acidobacteria bacterium]|nr:APC family permease [Acidobacteriota bacterium]